ncbi:MAG TPA: peptidoglycan recognition family protein [Treponemataceae bacterium]|nr:peptidoglycan recognition family protein [Treponemataceae bacterium]HPS45103.1 peptidoglycan recognition family protein [Treponemataceae bacterium]
MNRASRLRPVYIAAFLLALCGIAIAEPAADKPSVTISSTGILESYDGIPNRALADWKRDIAAYSLRHYGVETWSIVPTAIVLHYTASSGFPLNLIESRTFQDEAPGVASHFVIDEANGVGAIYQLLPLEVMSRATFGANFCSISIEMVARNEDDLLGKKALLDKAISLVRELMNRYDIPLARVYGHSEIDAMLAANPHGEFHDDTIEGAFIPRKVDPGERVMNLVRASLRGDTVAGEAH